MQHSSFVSSRLVSSSNTQVIIGLGVLYLSEILKVYLGPVLYRVVSIVTNTIVPSSFAGLTGDKSVPEVVDPVQAEIQRVKEVYKSPVEDRKAYKGSENDVYMLKTHGYKKHRFLSKSFIRRNNLKEEESDEL